MGSGSRDHCVRHSDAGTQLERRDESLDLAVVRSGPRGRQRQRNELSGPPEGVLLRGDDLVPEAPRRPKHAQDRPQRSP